MQQNIETPSSYSKGMTDTSNDLKGISFVYKLGLKIIDVQIQSFRAMDFKLSILTGSLGLFLTALLTFILTSEESISSLGLILLSLSFIFIVSTLIISLIALTSQKMNPGYNFERVIRWSNEDEKRICGYFSWVLLDAFKYNRDQLSSKFLKLRVALCLTIVSIVCIVAFFVQFLIERI